MCKTARHLHEMLSRLLLLKEFLPVS
uniref:Uncharacterized protein n=1 Tax=Anguilla anguilla TaxID=7936 RepID=A0A0E9VXM1_ANGAN